MTVRDDRLRAEVEAVLPSLPDFDMPCERKVMPVPSICGSQPTYLLKARDPRTDRRRAERRLYCRDHTLRSASVWRPVVHSEELNERLRDD